MKKAPRIMQFCSSFNNKKVMSMKDEITVAAAKAAPPVAVTSSHVMFNLTLNDWVALATLVYIGLQAFFLIRKELRRRNDE
jgi:hypothetical protein